MKDPENLDFETRMPEPEVLSLLPNDFVAFETGEAGEETATLGALESLHQEQMACTVKLMSPSGPGPWQQKTWNLSQRDGSPIKEQIGFHKLIARCELENNRLTQASVDTLRSRGVAI